MSINASCIQHTTSHLTLGLTLQPTNSFRHPRKSRSPVRAFAGRFLAFLAEVCPKSRAFKGSADPEKMPDATLCLAPGHMQPDENGDNVVCDQPGKQEGREE